MSRNYEVESAIETVFGKEGQRTTAQAVVWDLFQKIGYVDRPVFSGEFDTHKAAFADGRRSVFLEFRQHLENAKSPRANTTQNSK